MTLRGTSLRLAAAAAVLTTGVVTTGVHASSGSGSKNMLSGDAATFDKSVGGWTSTNATLSVDHSTVHSGSGSLLVKPPLGANLGTIRVRSKPIAVRAGHVFTSGIWATSSTLGAHITVGLSFLSGTGHVLSTIAGADRSVSGSWVKPHSSTALAPTHAKTVQVVVDINNPQLTTTVNLDDASLVDNGAPAGANVRTVRVRRHRIVDGSGHRLDLRGMSRVGLETDPTNALTTADAEAFKRWGANVVRLPLSANFWLRDGCAYDPDYRHRVRNVVRLLTARRIVTMIDLHTTRPCSATGKPPMPDAKKAVPFWRQVAHRYRGNRLVTFDLWNEPHDVTQHVWLHGGRINWGTYTYRAAGMQRLYHVVRSAGAHNVTYVAGLGWGSVPPRRFVHGHNIVYAAHAYTCPDKAPPHCNYSGNVNSAGKLLRPWLRVARHHAVLLNEFGWPTTTDPGKFTKSAIHFADRHHWGWVAFGFDGSVGDNFDLIGAKLGDGTYEPAPVGMPVLHDLARHL